MRKGKIMYFSLLLAVFLVSTAYFSYAFFTSKNEEHGKLNIVAGTLDYKIESDDLENNQITVKANEIKKIDIKLTSLNDISSEYELYYTLDKDNSSVRVGYDIDTKDSVLGTIATNGKKDITVVIRNESNTSTTVTFSVIGGLVNNELVLNEGNSLNQVVGKYIAYNIGEEITLIDGSKWHVLEASDENTEAVVLLSDYNLNSEAKLDATGSRNPIAFASSNNNSYEESDINQLINNFSNNIQLRGIMDVTIPTVEQIVQADRQFFNNEILSLSTSWLLTNDYWTKTKVNNNSTDLWIVLGEPASQINVVYASYGGNYGVRPAITTPKSNIVNTMKSTTELSIGTSVEAIDGSKWHVLEASSSNSKYVTLLSDYNLNSDGTYNTKCGRDINSEYYCSGIMFDSDNTNVYDEIDNNNIGYFMKNTYSPLITNALPGTINVTLPTAEQIATADSQTFSQESNLYLTANTWLATTSYWTSTAKTPYVEYVWVVSGPDLHLGIADANTNAFFGARPVITTLKTNLFAQ